jgi:hypothetical protein
MGQVTVTWTDGCPPRQPSEASCYMQSEAQSKRISTTAAILVSVTLSPRRPRKMRLEKKSVLSGAIKGRYEFLPFPFNSLEGQAAPQNSFFFHKASGFESHPLRQLSYFPFITIRTRLTTLPWASRASP